MPYTLQWPNARGEMQLRPRLGLDEAARQAVRIQAWLQFAGLASAARLLDAEGGLVARIDAQSSIVSTDHPEAGTVLHALDRAFRRHAAELGRALEDASR